MMTKEEKEITPNQKEAISYRGKSPITAIAPLTNNKIVAGNEAGRIFIYSYNQQGKCFSLEAVRNAYRYPVKFVEEVKDSSLVHTYFLTYEDFGRTIDLWNAETAFRVTSIILQEEAYFFKKIIHIKNGGFAFLQPEITYLTPCNLIKYDSEFLVKKSVSLMQKRIDNLIELRSGEIAYGNWLGICFVNSNLEIMEKGIDFDFTGWNDEIADMIQKDQLLVICLSKEIVVANLSSLQVITRMKVTNSPTKILLLQDNSFLIKIDGRKDDNLFKQLKVDSLIRISPEFEQEKTSIKGMNFSQSKSQFYDIFQMLRDEKGVIYYDYSNKVISVCKL